MESNQSMHLKSAVKKCMSVGGSNWSKPEVAELVDSNPQPKEMTVSAP